MGKRILIIDDDEQDQKAMSNIFIRSGFDEVSAVGSGKEALEKIQNISVDVVVLDTVLPDIDGFEVCEKIKEGNSKVKVVIITGNVDAVDAGKAKKSGADDYVVKTSDYQYLVDAIKKLE